MGSKMKPRKEWKWKKEMEKRDLTNTYINMYNLL